MFCSPFEESCIVSHGWFGNHLNSFDILTITSNLYEDVNSYVDTYSYTLFYGLDFSVWHILDKFTNASLMLLDVNYDIVMWLLCILFVTKVHKYSMDADSNVFRGIVNGIASFVYLNIVVAYLGRCNAMYFPYILYIFYFIMAGNLFGLIPSFFPLTSQLSTTLMLAFVCWLSILLISFYVHGMQFSSTFYPSKVPVVLSPFPMLIEFISFIVRLASLSLRLFANIVAGHILLDTIAVFFYAIAMTVNTSLNYTLLGTCTTLIVMMIVLLVFELLIAFLQAYIFVVLVVIYLMDALSSNAH